MEPRVGLEPTTYALQVRCTASCATAAYKGSNLRQSDYYIVELYPSGFRIFLMSTFPTLRASGTPHMQSNLLYLHFP